MMAIRFDGKAHFFFLRFFSGFPLGHERPPPASSSAQKLRRQRSDNPPLGGARLFPECFPALVHAVFNIKRIAEFHSGILSKPMEALARVAERTAALAFDSRRGFIFRSYRRGPFASQGLF
jgi:hypothetical protein